MEKSRGSWGSTKGFLNPVFRSIFSIVPAILNAPNQIARVLGRGVQVHCVRCRELNKPIWPIRLALHNLHVLNSGLELLARLELLVWKMLPSEKIADHSLNIYWKRNKYEEIPNPVVLYAYFPVSSWSIFANPVSRDFLNSRMLCIIYISFLVIKINAIRPRAKKAIVDPYSWRFKLSMFSWDLMLQSFERIEDSYDFIWCSCCYKCKGTSQDELSSRRLGVLSCHGSLSFP